MSSSEKAVGLVKSVLLFRETLDQLRKQIGDLRTDLQALARDHVELDKRVVRIETMIEMSVMRGGQLRIEGGKGNE